MLNYLKKKKIEPSSLIIAHYCSNNLNCLHFLVFEYILAVIILLLYQQLHHIFWNNSVIYLLFLLGHSVYHDVRFQECCVLRCSRTTRVAINRHQQQDVGRLKDAVRTCSQSCSFCHVTVIWGRKMHWKVSIYNFSKFAFSRQVLEHFASYVWLCLIL